jgi:prepilin-type N-terminal cleavage/methylation domain-containing protein
MRWLRDGIVSLARTMLAMSLVSMDRTALKHRRFTERRMGHGSRDVAAPFCCPDSRTHSGFTLIELLVVIAIIAILASLLLPALARAKAEGKKINCISNYRQLHLAWILYAQDYNQTFPWNNQNSNPGMFPSDPSWVAGLMQTSDMAPNWHDNTNTLKLVPGYSGSIGPYSKDAKIYRCPSDQSTAMINGQVFPRVRSVAMNYWVGTIPGAEASTKYAIFRKDQDLARYGPDQLFIFADVHEDSIQGPDFDAGLDASPLLGWLHFPGIRHLRSGVFSFGDGHVEGHKWRDSRTVRPATGNALYGGIQPANQDIQWVYDHTSVLKK